MEEAVEVLVVPHLVDRDAAGEIAQHRLVGVGGGLGDGTVEGGGAGFDHAARHHFQRLRRFELVDRAGHGIFREEARVAALPVEFGPDGLDVAPQRPAMLELFVFPVVDEPVGRLGAVREVPGQIARIEIGPALDERCARHEIEQHAVVAHARDVDAAVGDVVHRPR